MIRTKKFENLPQITTISPSGKIVITENGVDKVISFEDFSNLPPATEVWNNPSTIFTASEVNVTDIQSAADSKLLDLKINTVSKFVVRKDGNLGIGVANPAARLDISDTVLAGSGSLAGSILNLAQTWNTTGNPTAIKLNVTNTGSGATSNLLDLQVGGISQFKIDKSGSLTINSSSSPNASIILGGYSLGNRPTISNGGQNGFAFLINAANQMGLNQPGNGGLTLASDVPLNWSSNSTVYLPTVNVSLIPDGSGLLAMRNGVNPQTFRLYNTYTSSTNFERLDIKWDTNVLKIGTEKGSVGGTGRSLKLEAGTGFLNFDFNGPITLQGAGEVQPIYIQATGNASVHVKSSGNQPVLIDSANAHTSIRRSAGASTSDTLIVGMAQTDGSILNFFSKTNSVTNTEFSILGGSSYLRKIVFGGSVVAGGNLGTDVLIKSGLAGTNTLRCGDVYVYGMSSLGTGRSGHVILQHDSSVATNGNVGIGLTNPEAKLDVSFSHGIDGGFIYGIKSIVNGGSNNTNIAAYFSATNGSNQIALRTGTGKIDFNGELTTSGNIFLGAIPSATKGNLQIGDATSSFAAGFGGLLTFSGDTQAQGDPARSIFAFARGIKENGLYQNSLGALIFGTQSSSAVTGLLSTVTEKMRISSSGNLGIGTTTPLSRLDIAETWNSNISVTGASGTGSVATITFATQAAAIPVGATVVVSSVNPSGYNGTFVVTASTVTSISYTNSTSTTYVSGGLVKQQYDAIRAFITDTNSDTNSNLLSLNLTSLNVIGENWRYKVDKAGNLRSTGTHNIGIGLAGTATLNMGNGWYRFGNNNGIFILTNVTGYIFAHGDTQLWRGSADHIIEQRNGVNPQSFRIYNTYTDATTFERLNIKWDTNVLKIGTEKGNSGGTARDLVLETDGTERVRVLSTGNLGIGTITPQNKLDVNGDTRLGGWLHIDRTGGSITSYLAFRARGASEAGNFGNAAGNGQFEINAVNGSGLVIGTSNGPVILATQQSERLRITTNGNVGIGTTNPQSNLEIYGATSTLTINTGDATTTAGLRFAHRDSVYADSQIKVGIFAPAAGSFGLSTGLFFALNNATDNTNVSVSDSKLAILSSGNVGIGTSTPNLGSRDAAATYLTIYNAVADKGGVLELAGLNTANGGAVGTIAFTQNGFGSSASSSIFGYRDVSNGTLGLRFVAGGINRLTIDSAGRVGIGTNTPAARLDIADTTLAGSGSLEGSILNLAQTWNTTGAPTAIKLNITNTASGAASNLLDLQVGGVSQFKVDKSGTVQAYSITTNSSGALSLQYAATGGVAIHTNLKIVPAQGFISINNDLFLSRKAAANLKLGDVDAAAPVAQTLSVQSVLVGATNTAGANFTIDGSQGTGTGAGGSIIFRTAKAATSSSTVNSLTEAMSINSNGLITLLQAQTTGGLDLNGYGLISSFDWQLRNVNGFIGIGANFAIADTRLYRDAANILALRNGVNAQEFRLYNTYTDATTFERLNIKWDTNVLKIGTEKGSVGGTARNLELQIDGTTRLTLTSGNADFGVMVRSGGFFCNGGSGLMLALDGNYNTGVRLQSFIEGICRIANASGTDFNRLQFGGTTSSFPAIKRNGAALQIRLADDSANAALETAGLTVVGSASVSGHFSAATKSFLIDHPTKEGKKLQYGVVESNQHSVLVRGKTAENIIELPEEWAGLVHEDSVTVQLTPIGSYQQLFVISQDNQRVVVGGSTGQYNYTIYGERKDVDKLITEI